MPWRLLYCATAMCWAIVISPTSAPALDFSFKKVTINPKGRIDAIAYLGQGVVVAGSRGNNDTGYIFVSNDCGVTWRTIGNITGNDFITCLQSGGDGLGYLLTGRNVHVWKTTNYGETWTDLGQVSSAVNGAGFASAYGMVVTKNGTVLIADADGTGGHIYRSTDHGNSWQDIGKVSPHPLYRLNACKDGILVNGWAGRVYKSTDDGVHWVDMAKLTSSPLYAVEYVESDGTVLIGAENGDVFRSGDNCLTWRKVGKVGDAADDFAWLGKKHVLYSTYKGSRNLYVSDDAGRSWNNAGTIGTEHGDWFDHFICFEEAGARHLVGGTNKGLILYAKLEP